MLGDVFREPANLAYPINVFFGHVQFWRSPATCLACTQRATSALFRLEATAPIFTSFSTTFVTFQNEQWKHGLPGTPAVALAEEHGRSINLSISYDLLSMIYCPFLMIFIAVVTGGL